MSVFEPSDYSQYNTINEWFTRPFKPGIRPLEFPNNVTVIVSVADCRLLTYNSIGEAQTFTIKEHDFTVTELLGLYLSVKCKE